MYFRRRSGVGFRRFWMGGLILALVLLGGWFALSRWDSSLYARGWSMRSVGQYVVQPPIPQEMTFAGEEVPLCQMDVREALDHELGVAAHWHSQMLLILKRAGRYFPVIEPILREQGVPDDFKYLAVVESTLNEAAVSPMRAEGLWQLLETTGKEYGLRIDANVDERYHLERSTVAACQYLKRSYDEFGSWALAAAAYNMGRGGVRRTRLRQSQDSYYDLKLRSETARYVYRILAFKLILEHPEDYGYFLTDEDLYAPYPCQELTVDSTLDDLSRFAMEQGTSLKLLRLLNPWLRSNCLPVDSGEVFSIRIMTESLRRGGGRDDG